MTPDKPIVSLPKSREELRAERKAEALVALLSDSERIVLRMRADRFATTPRGSAVSDALSLRALGLLESVTWFDDFVGIKVRGFRFTPLGREVARCLDVAHG